MARSLFVLLACLLVFNLLIAIDATSVILSVTTITISLDGDATQSFWIGAAYLLAMCVSQPILARFSDVCGRKSTILASSAMLGVGSLISADSTSMSFLLLGRTIQGLGAGGLTALSYIVYGDLDSLGLAGTDGTRQDQTGMKFLTAISCSAALGTVCGPLIGAALSYGSGWRWLFRLNLPFCLGLGALVYSTNDDIYKTTGDATKLSNIDLVSAVLSVGFIVPLLVGLSFAGSRYEWADWRTAAPAAVGCACLLLFLVWELRLCHSWLPFRKYKEAVKPFTGLVVLKNTQGVSAVIGAVLLGALMYALLFFLPIYYLVIKGHSILFTALLLLSQTLMMAPCGAAVFVLVEKVNLSSHQVIVCGWICTAIGFGLLSLLDASKTVLSDVLLNLASGAGIGILLPALTLGAKDSVRRADKAQAPMVLVYMRYLGSASGLIATGLAFQRLLNRNLATTQFKSTAKELTKHATTLMHSINKIPNSQDRKVLVEATQNALSTIWIALAITCTFLVVLSCASIAAAADKRELKVTSHHLVTQDSIKLHLPDEPDLTVPGQSHHWSRYLVGDPEGCSPTLRGYPLNNKETRPI